MNTPTPSEVLEGTIKKLEALVKESEANGKLSEQSLAILRNRIAKLKEHETLTKHTTH